MTTPDSPADKPGVPNPSKLPQGQPKPPSLVPGVVLLVLAAVLIVITLLKPDIPRWATVSIAVLAVIVVIALLLYAFKAFRDVTKPGGSR